MSKFILLASIGLLTETEAARDDAEGLARARVTAMRKDGTDLSELRPKLEAADKKVTDLEGKITASEKAVKDAAEKRAGDLVTAAVTDGRIPAADEAGQKYFRERIAAGDTYAEKILAEKAKLTAGLDTPIIGGGQPRQPLTATALDTRAQALITAGQAKDIDEARDLIFASDPGAYSAYLASLTPAA